MAFPDSQLSIVTEDKLCDYLLNPSHPVGGPKATPNPIPSSQLQRVAPSPHSPLPRAGEGCRRRGEGVTHCACDEGIGLGVDTPRDGYRV